MVLGGKIIIGLDYLMEIRFHQLKHYIDIPELSPGRRKHNMLNFHNIRMSKQPQELNFSKDPCGIGYMLKNITYFLDCNPFTRVSINGRTHNTITSFSNNLLDLVLTRLSILSKKL
ncbi:hypothetical protein V8G54_004785 [Vigna mungo]|uniref:Uncharacterized protein n=1 Tax=Vigna mungo TaxID=3915 RepID=A0AAQ3PE56_VIGMU